MSERKRLVLKGIQIASLTAISIVMAFVWYTDNAGLLSLFWAPFAVLAIATYAEIRLLEERIEALRGQASARDRPGR